VSEHRGAITREGERYPSPRRALDYLEAGPPEPGQAVQVAPNLLWARIPLPMELNHINVWLHEDADGWTLVDTGMAEDVCRAAWPALEAGPMQGRPLRRVFVTHDHPDHMGLSPWLHQRHGAAVWMSAMAHGSSAAFFEARTADVRGRQFAFFAQHGLHIGEEARERMLGEDHARWYGGSPPLARAVADGERIEAGGREWQVIEVSGHCRGHLCLYDPRGELLISGDQVLPTISPNVSVLASRPDADPLGEFLDSLDRLARCAHDTLVLPSHGRPFRGLHRRLEVVRAHHEQQLEALHAACREPQLAFDLLPVMYGRPLRGFHRFLALGETVAHLNRLWHAGRLRREPDDAGQLRFVAA
jgi:glyoxylase-like metal-dependent hydrolase (beta-lactamase superfamily II)